MNPDRDADAGSSKSKMLSRSGEDQNADNALLFEQFEESIKRVKRILTQRGMDDVAEARRWAQGAIHTLQSVMEYIGDFADGDAGESAPLAHVARTVRPMALPASGEPAPQKTIMMAEKRFGRNRLGLMIDFVILETVTAASSDGARAASITAIFQQLVKVELIHKGDSAKAALVTRLNRMKSKNLLTWDGRVPDIKIGPDGGEYAAQLHTRLLTADEVSFIDGRKDPFSVLRQIGKPAAD